MSAEILFSGNKFAKAHSAIPVAPDFAIGIFICSSFGIDTTT